MFVQYLGAKPNLSLSFHTGRKLAQITPDNQMSGIGLFKYNTADQFANDFLKINPNKFYRTDGKKTYQWWRKLARDYGTMLFADQPQSIFFQEKPATGAKLFPT